MSKIVLENTGLPAPIGYARAVRATGTHTIYTSMTAPVDPAGAVVGPDDAAAQSRRALENIGDILEQNGASVADVVQVTAFYVREQDGAAVMTQIAAWAGPSFPAVSLAAVTGLPNPAFLVEIAAVAVVD